MFHLIRFALPTLLLAGVGLAQAADLTIDQDWSALRAQYAQEPARFAAEVPLALSSEADGQWSTENELRVWRLSIAAPGATSMSLHASRLVLPRGAQLSIGGSPHTAGAQADNGLWSRTVAGDELLLEAVMPPEVVPLFAIEIAKVFTGFAAPVGIPAQRKSAVQAKGSATPAGCEIENYSCLEDAGNRDASRSVVAYSVNGAFACTATLMTNNAQDYRPYLLSAAHCFSDASPEASAATVVVYWNAITPCGDTLDSASAAASHSQGGATHRARVAESWLIELNSPPPAGANPYFLGFDATDITPGNAPLNISHGSFEARQIALFRSPPVKSTLNGTTVGSLGLLNTPSWDVYSSRGRTVSGSSGSPLMTAANYRSIGTLYGGSSEECDVADPPANAGDRSVFQRLAYGWDGDGLALVTLRDYLDPAGTGTRVANGSYSPARRAAPAVSLNAEPAPAGGTRLSWSSSGLVIGCIADGDWAGEKAGSGAEVVPADYQSGVFDLACFSEGPQAGTARVSAAGATSSTRSTGTAAGGGGGGSLGWLLLVMAGGLLRRR